MYALIQEDDIKSRKLADEIHGIELLKMKGSTNLIPLHLINEITKRRKLPKAIILRYLNDSNTFIKSLSRLFTNIITVFLAKMLRIKLIWICHNVDKESKENYPFIVRFRRKMMTILSNKILVTDKYLIKHAARFLGVKVSKIDYITFGKPNLSTALNVNDEIHQKIVEFAQNKEGERNLVGISIGNPNPKVLQPFYTDELIKKAAEFGINLKIILGGPLGDFIKKNDEKTYSNLLSNPNVLFLDGQVKLDEQYLSRYIDFYWRVYDDFSVPYTVYNAVTLNKPVLTMNKGFLNEMVLKYNLGSVLNDDMSNMLNAIEDVIVDRSEFFNEFTETHNWKIGAKQIYKAIFIK